MPDQVIITVAPTGAWPTRADNPAIPFTPKEIAEDVYECYKAGASVAHLHVRDDEGLGTMCKERFREASALVQEKCDIILNLTTSGDLKATEETRTAHLVELRPELASFDCGSMNWAHDSLFLNHPKFLERLGRCMIDNGVKPEVEIFDAGMVYNSLHYIKKGFLKPPVHYQFVLGAAGGIAGTVQNLVFLLSLIPPDSTWSALGVGKDHLPVLYATLALGGHVRVGMEDNVFYSKGALAGGNVDFVARAARLVREINRAPATPAQARAILGLGKK
ncbi:MAG: 3-keto-5-aminohexanoate cleavage protein [Deltaproteobacteria bacterium]|nr:3-keto-5-aminohexanoate cleavage protein [Deltaproteobacteria bacterium]